VIEKSNTVNKTFHNRLMIALNPISTGRAFQTLPFKLSIPPFPRNHLAHLQSPININIRNNPKLKSKEVAKQIIK
jgi:hypothetical protein